MAVTCILELSEEGGRNQVRLVLRLSVYAGLVSILTWTKFYSMQEKGLRVLRDDCEISIQRQVVDLLQKQRAVKSVPVALTKRKC